MKIWCALVIFFLGSLSLAQEPSQLNLKTAIEKTSGTKIQVGSFRVFENRETKKGRTIDLNIMVLPALGEDRSPDPVFILAGGPGVAVTSGFRGHAKSWIRENRDIVLVDQRGTGKSNPLRVKLKGDDSNIQGYLDPIFNKESFKNGMKQLEKTADLTQYSTCAAMDDLNEIRAALGYDKINLMGGSYGTRAALVYMRRHPETVRTAVLNGVAPISFVNPLYHAPSAQEGFDRLCEEINQNPRYKKAFPNLKKKLESILKRLAAKPARVKIPHPVTKKREEVILTKDAFAEALRVMMYYTSTNRHAPRLIFKAYQGDYESFAVTGMSSNRSIRNMIHFGMLMCVTGGEDIPRIDPKLIPKLCDGTFLGDVRVRDQMAVARFWPKSKVPSNYGEPVGVDTPTLILSGTHDPVTPPSFGEAAAKHLKKSLHLVVPGAHGVSHPVITRITKDFLNSGAVTNLDLSGVKDIRLPPLAMPKDS